MKKGDFIRFVQSFYALPNVSPAFAASHGIVFDSYYCSAPSSGFGSKKVLILRVLTSMNEIVDVDSEIDVINVVSSIDDCYENL